MFLSVIIPTYNRPKELRRALESLAEQKWPKADFEVLIINDGSYKSLNALVDDFAAKLNIRYFFQAHRGASVARNLGIKEAKGEILVFFDDDAIAAKNWLKNIVEAMTNEYIVVGRVKPIKGDFWQYFAPHYNQGETIKTSPIILEGNLAVKKSIFEEVGLFDENLDYGHEGQEWYLRLDKKYTVKYYPNVIIYHDYASSVKNYFWKQFKFGEKKYYLEHLGKKIEAGQGPVGENVALETLSTYRKLLVKVVAKIGQVFHQLGFYFGHFKY